MNKYKDKIDGIELDKNLLKPLYDTVLIETKIFDNESKLIWLDSLRLLLEKYKDESEDWFKEVMGIHEFNECSFVNKCWKFAIEIRDYLGDKFYNIF